MTDKYDGRLYLYDIHDKSNHMHLIISRSQIDSHIYRLLYVLVYVLYN